MKTTAKLNPDSMPCTVGQVKAMIESLDVDIPVESIVNAIVTGEHSEKLAATVGAKAQRSTEHLLDAMRRDVVNATNQSRAALELSQGTDAIYKATMEKVEKALADKSTSVTTVRRIKAALVSPTPSTGANPVEQAMQQYCEPKNSAYPVLVMGDPSAGKTYTTRKWGESKFDLFIEQSCHQGIEARDILGGNILTSCPKSGGMISRWVDGRVTYAVRMAAAGKSVLLLLDEIYRAPQREMNALLGFLSPVTKPDGSKVYRLCSDKPIDDGHGNLIPEVVECPVENLAIVGTTNVGGQFQIESPDPAMKTRWVMVYVHLTADDFKSVVLGYVKGAKFRESVANELTRFWTEMSVLKADGYIEDCPTYRTIERAISIAKSDDKKDIGAAVEEGIYSYVGIDLNGRPETEQINKVKSVIKSIWG